MSRTFICRAVHGEAHFSRPEEEQAQNRKILKCSVWGKDGGCTADAAQMAKDEVQEVFWSEIESYRPYRGNWGQQSLVSLGMT